MKTFLAVSAQKRPQGVEAWNQWAENHAKFIVEDGGPLGRTRRVAKDGISDIRNNLVAYVVVTAESREEAAKMFLHHPHFAIFPGDGVEIMEGLQIPPKA